jgi:hypothetical protein
MSIARNDQRDDGLALVELELEPREQIIWSGKPRSVAPIVWRSAPKAIMGAASLVFLAIWMIVVIRGGHNNWDKGQVVQPFAPHNVLIALIAGLWITPFCLYLALMVGSLMAVCIFGDVVLVCALLIIGPKRLFGPRPPGLKPVGAEIVVATAAGLGFSLLMAVVVCGMFFHFALRIPVEITIDEGRRVRFRGRLRTVTVPVSDLVLIQTGRWFDPNRFQMDVVHKRGKLTMINRFSNFTDFLVTVKELNPSLEIKGF